MGFGKQKIMEKEADYYYVLNGKKLKCTLCPHECILLDGQMGICKARKNIDGKLIALSYSNACAVNIDPIEKKPLFHFLPRSKTFSIASAGCSLSCKNCQNYTISQKGPEQTQNYFLSPKDIVAKALENNCESISFTYTEPLVFYEYTLETAKIAHQNNLKNVIVSSGYVNAKPLENLIPFIDAANIDLKSFDDKIYKKLSSAHLQPVLDSLKILRQSNVWLEITNLIIPEYTDDLEMIDEMCKWLIDNGFEDAPLHFSKFFPVYKLSEIEPTADQTIEKAIEIAYKNGLKYVYAGNVRANKYENTYCPKCGTILIERYGFDARLKNMTNGKCENCEEKIEGIWTK